MSYRELAIIDKSFDKNAELRELAYNAIDGFHSKLDKFINKLDSQILPKVAKQGKFDYIFKFPLWFRLINSKEHMHAHYQYIVRKMECMGYKTVIPRCHYGDCNIYAIRFSW